jgi:RNA polymerase sigma-70 factor (ECF subfamily)
MVGTLAERFRAHLEAGVSSLQPPDESLELLLRRLTERGRRAWPSLRVDEELWLAALARSCNRREELERVCAEDLFLACACGGGDAQAQMALEQLFSRVRGAIRRVSPAPDFVEEVLQEVRTRVLIARKGDEPRISGYAGGGTLISWLRAIAVRTALELRHRKHESSLHEGSLASSAGLAQDPELVFLREQYREDFRLSFAAALEALEARDLAVLKLSLLDSLSLEQIGSIYQVHAASVSRWLTAARTRLLDQTRQTLTQRLSLSRSELDSMMRLFQADLDVSLVSFLRRHPASGLER